MLLHNFALNGILLNTKVTVDIQLKLRIKLNIRNSF